MYKKITNERMEKKITPTQQAKNDIKKKDFIQYHRS